MTDKLIQLNLDSFQNNYKNQKPILEKRRRDRINNSLDELKGLLLAIKQRDVSSNIQRFRDLPKQCIKLILETKVAKVSFSPQK